MAAVMVTIDVSTDWSASGPVVAPSSSVAEGVLISLTIDPVLSGNGSAEYCVRYDLCVYEGRRDSKCIVKRCQLVNAHACTPLPSSITN